MIIKSVGARDGKGPLQHMIHCTKFVLGPNCPHSCACSGNVWLVCPVKILLTSLHPFVSDGVPVLTDHVMPPSFAPRTFGCCRGVQTSTGHKAPWKIGNFTTAHFLQEEAVLSPCNFATTHLTAFILNSGVLSPLNFATHEMETLPRRPIEGTFIALKVTFISEAVH